MGRPRKALHSVLPTTERFAQGGIVIENTENENSEIRTRAKVKWPTTVHRLHGRDKITASQFLCALDLQYVHQAAIGSPQVVSQYSDMVSHGSVQSAFARKEDAWAAYNAAARLLDEHIWAEVRRIVIEGEAPKTRTALRRLKKGLDALEDWGGLRRSFND